MRALVTGGTGFLGGALAQRLLARGDIVTVLGRNAAAGARLQVQGMRFLHGDLADALAVHKACAEQDVVFHCGAHVAPWGRYQDFYATNVSGTQNVIDSCLAHQVGRLIHVSTPSIYFTDEDRLNVNEHDPLPSHFVNAYTATKFQAEQAIERAYRNGLPVITVRPRGLFGPGDTTILPRVIAAVAQKRLRIIGPGHNVQDLTYIDNAVDALLLCQAAPATTLGKKYNITNGEPVQVWVKLRALCEQLGYSFPQRHVAFGVAFAGAWLLEALHNLRPSLGEPQLTCYAVSLLAKSMTLDISAARRDLGYQPNISMDEGLARFVQWWKAIHP